MTYNWAEEVHDHDNFLAWSLPTLLVGTDTAVMDEISEATNRWTEVDLKITINGVEMDYREFFTSIHLNMKHHAKQYAADTLRENSNLAELENLVANLQHAVKRAMVDSIAGTPLEGCLDNDDRY